MPVGRKWARKRLTVDRSLDYGRLLTRPENYDLSLVSPDTIFRGLHIAMARIALLLLTTLTLPAPHLQAQDKQGNETAKTQDKEAPEKKSEWVTLFDGKKLQGWEVAKGFDYEEKGKVDVKDGCLIIGTGQPATGVRWTGKFPKTNYEVELEGKRVDGSDFFCGMSFPVGDGALTLILGGWGGWVVGLSCVDGYRAVDNETCTSIEFKNDRWYRIRVKVTKEEVVAYVDDQRICGIATKGRKFTVTSEMEPCLPFGFATWVTTGALRKIRYRPLPVGTAVEDKK